MEKNCYNCKWKRIAIIVNGKLKNLNNHFSNTVQIQLFIFNYTKKDYIVPTWTYDNNVKLCLLILKTTYAQISHNIRTVPSRISLAFRNVIQSNHYILLSFQKYCQRF